MANSSYGIRVWVIERGDRGKFVARAEINHGIGEITRKQKTLESTTRKKAEREAQRWEDELIEKEKRPGADRTWTEFLKLYRDDYLPNTSKSNRRNWNTVVDRVEAVAKKRKLRLHLLSDVTPELLSYVRTALEKSVKPSSVKSYMGTLRAGLNWASEELGWIDPLPKQRQRGRLVTTDSVMRGRPLTSEEVDRLIAACDDEFPGHAQGWKDLIKGLYLSGLRFSEAIGLHWSRLDTHHPVSLQGRRPKILFTSAQKNRTDQLVAIVPEFAEWLRGRKDQSGWVFNPTTRAGRAESVTHISRRLAEVGERAKVVTIPATDDGQEASFATAHDLRRSFGHRWAAKVMPPILQHLMRHRSIETTLRYYVGSSADQASRAVWEAWKSGAPQIDGALLSADNLDSCDQIGDQLADAESDR